MENTKKISEAISTYDLSVLIVLLGVLSIGVIGWFGWWLFSKRKTMVDPKIIEDALEFWKETNIRPNIPKYATEAYNEYLQRRNEFWSIYGQILLAIVIIVVLAVLLLAKVISAEAGLPILSAVSGFAIAKGVSTSRGASNDNDRLQ